MGETSQTSCACGRPTLEYLTYCSTCTGRRQGRHSRHSSLPQDRSSLTPPPEAISAPKTPKRMSASAALSTAFASEEEQPSLFPAHFYRTPDRSRSRPKTSPQRSSDSPASMERTGPHRDSGEYNRPISGFFEARDRSYSPMAAGFARLSIKDRHLAPPEWRGRPSSPRSTIELSARMFDGPA